MNHLLSLVINVYTTFLKTKSTKNNIKSISQNEESTENSIDLISIVLKRDIEELRQILANGKKLGLNINARDKDRNTALILAVGKGKNNGKAKLVELLLAHEGIDTYLKNCGNYDALDIAKNKGLNDIVEMIECKRLEQKLALERKKHQADLYKRKGKVFRAYDVGFSFQETKNSNDIKR